ncbi:sodium/glutamate symporter [Clostridium peptidivorans]|uniref:sodium/glutamate symporter n=1 Tax=Clostridium peptidivorans TaxID=100174 RepID=UPI000BE36BE0|nr:sodium/glutamate symporter [Clostridium peptidivorans]
MEIKLDMMQTTALAVVIYYFGGWVKSKWKLLYKFCIPDPVVGGLIFSIVNLFLRQSGTLKLTLDTTLQSPFMMVFFTSIGFTASLQLVKKGGLQVAIFWLVASVLALLQDALGVTIAKALGQNPLLGLICGSVTMTGGHGTGGAFGPVFEQMGLQGATTFAMAAATFGLVSGSLMGGPLGRRLIETRNLKSHPELYVSQEEVNAASEEAVSYEEFFRSFALLLIALGIGAVLGNFFKKLGITLPAYVSAMIIAAIILNVGESTGKWHVNQKCTEIIGSIGLNIFLSMALISLKLWELAAVAGPMLVILLAQVVMMWLFAYYVTFNIMGKDFDAAVMSAGHCGFGMGATPNAMANMRSVVERFGAAPRAFFVLPIVGAFLIDFTNAIIITTFANFFGK